MKCPFCHETENRVIDSRLSKDGHMVRRRRECLKCSRRFTTYERVEETMPLVVKKDGRRETYDRVKIVNGLKRACEKRPVSINTIEAIADRIVIINEGKIIAQGTQAELSEQVHAKGAAKQDLSLEDIFIALLMPKNAEGARHLPRGRVPGTFGS